MTENKKYPHLVRELKISNGVEKQYSTAHPAQTKKLGEDLAKKILKTRAEKRAFILGLEGDLGGGKTTFLQGFAKGLGIKEKILSPTFVIVKKFQIPKVKNQKPKTNSQRLYHVDCCRIEKPKEILDLGFKEIISNPKNIVAVEWADRVKKIMPPKTLWVKFELANKNKRKILITNTRSWLIK